MGPTIAIGANIYRHRKEVHLTQDDLARHLGITKASMSKWETGQSYPDVEMPPRIATYFDVTVDAFMGYEPQMSREGIRRECARLRDAFATMPFDKAQPWLEDINGIGTSAPRDDSLVRKSLVESVAANPAFEPLSDEPRFKRIIERLREVAQ